MNTNNQDLTPMEEARMADASHDAMTAFAVSYETIKQRWPEDWERALREFHGSMLRMQAERGRSIADQIIGLENSNEPGATGVLTLARAAVYAKHQNLI